MGKKPADLKDRFDVFQDLSRLQCWKTIMCPVFPAREVLGTKQRMQVEALPDFSPTEQPSHVVLQAVIWRGKALLTGFGRNMNKKWVKSKQRHRKPARKQSTYLVYVSPIAPSNVLTFLEDILFASPCLQKSYYSSQPFFETRVLRHWLFSEADACK